MNGHWYCSFCNDIVNIRKPWGRWDKVAGESCPVCHNNSANWISTDLPPAENPLPPQIKPERAAILFTEIKNSIQ